MISVFFNDTATTEIYTLALHDALPIFGRLISAVGARLWVRGESADGAPLGYGDGVVVRVVERRRPEFELVASVLGAGDRQSTRLNSSHANISYALFCLSKNTSPFLVAL